MNKLTWFLIGNFIATALKLPALVGVMLGAFLAFRYSKPTQQSQWNYNFHTFSHGAYHHHLFGCLGMIAKADNLISKNEIAYATQCMQQLGLNYSQQAIAKSTFKKGADGVNLQQICQYMRILSMQNPQLVQQFYQQLHTMANIDPPISRQQTHILNQIRYNLHQGQYQQSYQQQSYSPQGHHSLQQSYQTLGVHSKMALKDIKRAYQKLIGKYHPDRLRTQKEKSAAEEKVKQLHQAWDTIRQHHPTEQSA
ncbi:DnaJ domain-containing protein [Gammaproteobacteria bacterium]|nr:DnaJ domain-containing protein [Gammaproteobacteria bacterium]